MGTKASVPTNSRGRAGRFEVPHGIRAEKGSCFVAGFFETDLFFEQPFDLTHFLQDLGNGSPSTIRGLVPEIHKTLFELFLSHLYVQKKSYPSLESVFC